MIYPSKDSFWNFTGELKESENKKGTYEEDAGKLIHEGVFLPPRTSGVGVIVGIHLQVVRTRTFFSRGSRLFDDHCVT